MVAAVMIVTVIWVHIHVYRYELTILTNKNIVVLIPLSVRVRFDITYPLIHHTYTGILVKLCETLWMRLRMFPMTIIITSLFNV